jgi:methyl-accepting chemotaxis protein
MQFLDNLKIGTRLIALTAITSLLLLMGGLLGGWGLHNSSQALMVVFDRHLLSINQLQQVRLTQFQMRNDIFQARLLEDGFAAQEIFDRVDKRIRTISESLEAYQKQPLSEQERKLLQDYIAVRTDFGVNGIGKMRDLLNSESFDEADQLSANVMDPSFARVLVATDALIDHLTAEAGAYRAKTEKVNNVLLLVYGVGVGVGLLLSIVLGLVIRASIVRGAGNLEAAATRLAQGDLTVNVKITGKDEFSQVAVAFNRMSAEFNQIVGEIRGAADKISLAANGTTNNSQNVAASSNRQEQSAQNANAAANFLTQAVDEIGGYIGDMVRSADQASDLARKGQSVISDAVAGISAISHSVNQTSGMIGSLGEHSDVIGQIVSVIKDIADQTNLLALNAAIEAARAGEQGRGFAVVADEVRKLAERTTRATGEISTTVVTIQNETAQAVHAMELAQKEVTQGVEKARQGDRAILDITQAVSSLTNQIHSIDDIRAKQDESSRDIVSRIQEILRMAQSNRSASESSAQAAATLTELSTHLTSAVSRFRL